MVKEEKRIPEEENETAIPDFHVNELTYMLEVMLARAKNPLDSQDEKLALISALRFAYMLMVHPQITERGKSLAEYAALICINILGKSSEGDKYGWN